MGTVGRLTNGHSSHLIPGILSHTSRVCPQRSKGNQVNIPEPRRGSSPQLGGNHRKVVLRCWGSKKSGNASEPRDTVHDLEESSLFSLMCFQLCERLFFLGLVSEQIGFGFGF